MAMGGWTPDSVHGLALPLLLCLLWETARLCFGPHLLGRDYGSKRMSKKIPGTGLVSDRSWLITSAKMETLVS